MAWEKNEQGKGGDESCKTLNVRGREGKDGDTLWYQRTGFSEGTRAYVPKLLWDRTVMPSPVQCSLGRALAKAGPLPLMRGDPTLVKGKPLPVLVNLLWLTWYRSFLNYCHWWIHIWKSFEFFFLLWNKTWHKRLTQCLLLMGCNVQNWIPRVGCTWILRFYYKYHFSFFFFFWSN